MAVGVLSVPVGAPDGLARRPHRPAGQGPDPHPHRGAFVTPSFLGATAWVILAGPNAGLLNVLYRALTGAEAPLVNIFSMTGLIS